MADATEEKPVWAVIQTDDIKRNLQVKPHLLARKRQRRPTLPMRMGRHSLVTLQVPRVFPVLHDGQFGVRCIFPAVRLKLADGRYLSIRSESRSVSRGKCFLRPQHRRLSLDSLRQTNLGTKNTSFAAAAICCAELVKPHPSTYSLAGSNCKAGSVNHGAM